MITAYQRGMIEGELKGMREYGLLQLEAKFGLLPSAVKERVETLSSDQLLHIAIDIIKATSLQELHLTD